MCVFIRKMLLRYNLLLRTRKSSLLCSCHNSSFFFRSPSPCRSYSTCRCHRSCRFYSWFSFSSSFQFNPFLKWSLYPSLKLTKLLLISFFRFCLYSIGSFIYFSNISMSLCLYDDALVLHFLFIVQLLPLSKLAFLDGARLSLSVVNVLVNVLFLDHS